MARHGVVMQLRSRCSDTLCRPLQMPGSCCMRMRLCRVAGGRGGSHGSLQDLACMQPWDMRPRLWPAECTLGAAGLRLAYWTEWPERSRGAARVSATGPAPSRPTFMVARGTNVTGG
jgi:hypothetical protein